MVVTFDPRQVEAGRTLPVAVCAQRGNINRLVGRWAAENSRELHLSLRFSRRVCPSLHHP